MQISSSRYTDEFDSDNWPVASVRLRLNDRAQLAEITPVLADVKTAEVTRYYSDDHTAGFDPQPENGSVSKRAARLTPTSPSD